MKIARLIFSLFGFWFSTSLLSLDDVTELAHHRDDVELAEKRDERQESQPSEEDQLRELEGDQELTEREANFVDVHNSFKRSLARRPARVDIGLKVEGPDAGPL